MRQASILLEAGGKDLIQIQDRWEHTPLDEAKRVQAQPLVKLLEQTLRDETRSGESARHRWW